MKSVSEFIDSIEHVVRKSDARVILSIMEEVSGYPPYLSGSIIGFGHYHYKYESGLEGESCVVGFSPRKQNLVLYIMPGFTEIQELLSSLGKHKTGRSCLYINKLKDIDINILKKIIRLAVDAMQKKYVCH